MADSRKTVQIKSDPVGDVRIADEVVAIIAGLAATEVDGVSSMAGNITNEIVSKLGMKNLSKGIMIEIMDNEVTDHFFHIDDRFYIFSLIQLFQRFNKPIPVRIGNLCLHVIKNIGVAVIFVILIYRYCVFFP